MQAYILGLLQSARLSLADAKKAAKQAAKVRNTSPRSRILHTFSNIEVIMFNSVRLYFAKRNLESELAKVIGLMDGHKAVGVSAGASAHRTLLERSGDSIDKYIAQTAKLGKKVASRAEIEVGAPQLRKLKALANGKPEKYANVGFAIGIVIGTFISGTVIAMYLGLWHDIYLYVAHFARVWGWTS